ncbi:MAG: hypothetical protein WA984_15030 [Phormidesmis sp.]
MTRGLNDLWSRLMGEDCVAVRELDVCWVKAGSYRQIVVLG